MKTGLVPIFTIPVTTGANSTVITAEDLLYISAQMVVTGVAPVGTIQLQVSNDYLNSGDSSKPVPTNWTAIGTSVAINGVGSYVIPKTDLCYQYVRVAFVLASGTIAMSGTIKTIGA